MRYLLTITILALFMACDNNVTAPSMDMPTDVQLSKGIDDDPELNHGWGDRWRKPYEPPTPPEPYLQVRTEVKRIGNDVFNTGQLYLMVYFHSVARVEKVVKFVTVTNTGQRPRTVGIKWVSGSGKFSAALAVDSVPDYWGVIVEDR